MIYTGTKGEIFLKYTIAFCKRLPLDQPLVSLAMSRKIDMASRCGGHLATLHSHGRQTERTTNWLPAGSSWMWVLWYCVCNIPELRTDPSRIGPPPLNTWLPFPTCNSRCPEWRRRATMDWGRSQPTPSRYESIDTALKLKFRYVDEDCVIYWLHRDDLVQDFSISSALALEIQQRCTKPSIGSCKFDKFRRSQRLVQLSIPWNEYTLLYYAPILSYSCHVYLLMLFRITWLLLASTTQDSSPSRSIPIYHAFLTSVLFFVVFPYYKMGRKHRWHTE